MEDIIDFSQILDIMFANIKTRKLVPNPKIKANIIELFTAFRPSKKFFWANCSETMQVQARLRPEVAIVTTNIYTDITKLKTPTASEPIFFETYKPKNIYTCALLDKKCKRKVDFELDYAGTEIGDYFLVGYGLDFDEIERNTKYIFVPDEEEIKALAELAHRKAN